MKIQVPKKIPQWVDGKDLVQSKKTFLNLNPYNEGVICEVSEAETNEVEAAINSAIAAQKKWSLTPPKERAKILTNAANLLRSHNDMLASIESLETGRPIRETSVVDVTSGADCLQYFASLIQVIASRHVDLGNNTFGYTLLKPLGVCLGIGAWNYPLQIACWKSAPCLAAGNAMIFKPSELSPSTAYLLGNIYKEAGLPDGLFNVLQGDGKLGAELISRQQIKKVSLTGSVSTGKKIYEACSKTLKKISLELGGKGPLIIFEDADLESAVHAAMAANFYSQGEICSNGTRVFIHEAIKEKFLKILAQKTSHLKLGNQLDPATHIGPLISQIHREKVIKSIEAAKKTNANLMLGGQHIGHNIVEPTIFTECQDDMLHCKDEIFGPVMSVLSFRDEKDVILRANNSEYGLAGGIFTSNVARAHRVSRQLEVGICWINQYNITPIEIPFGGSKLSGIGRENGIEALHSYSETQTIYFEGNKVPNPFA